MAPLDSQNSILHQLMTTLGRQPFLVWDFFFAFLACFAGHPTEYKRPSQPLCTWAGTCLFSRKMSLFTSTDPLQVCEHAAVPSPFERIEHVVVLMMENRSFDHMLGFLPRKR